MPNDRTSVASRKCPPEDLMIIERTSPVQESREVTYLKSTGSRLDNAQRANAAKRPHSSLAVDNNTLFFAPGKDAPSSFPDPTLRDSNERRGDTTSNSVNPHPAPPLWPPLESSDRGLTPIPDDWELTHSKSVDDMVKNLYEGSIRNLPRFPPHLDAFTCALPPSSFYSPTSSHPNSTANPLVTSAVSNNHQAAPLQSLLIPSVFLSPNWAQTAPQITVQRPATLDASRQQMNLQTNQRFNFDTPSSPMPTLHSSSFDPQKFASLGPFRVSKSSSDIVGLGSSSYATSIQNRSRSSVDSPASIQNLKLDMRSPIPLLRKGKSTSSIIRSSPIVHETPETERSEYQSPLKLRIPVSPRPTPNRAPESPFRLSDIPSNLQPPHARLASSLQTPPIIAELPHLIATNQGPRFTPIPRHTTGSTSIPIITSSFTHVTTQTSSDDLTTADIPVADNAIKFPVLLKKPLPLKRKTSHTSLSTAAIQKGGNAIRKKVSTTFSKAKSHLFESP
ncbi:hypothetical protein I314_02665 [Cryptococcus bacillisporus CA1873]|uniref:Uncharacterized protein n=1 Tax=Cryptococcus bacillisporus CA1873 TaxID=1296111 RepID=A0ABR5BC94_CRYGA|nr:hypothetical protein I314_02665 [Cryptococcus bacillisporus CA1873]|eukprot:KIR63884.1 hypothetical protein I314_02665 [Cryptococcus gattii CA1873]